MNESNIELHGEMLEAKEILSFFPYEYSVDAWAKRTQKKISLNVKIRVNLEA